MLRLYILFFLSAPPPQYGLLLTFVNYLNMGVIIRTSLPAPHHELRIGPNETFTEKWPSSSLSPVKVYAGVEGDITKRILVNDRETVYLLPQRKRDRLYTIKITEGRFYLLLNNSN